MRRYDRFPSDFSSNQQRVCRPRKCHVSVGPMTFQECQDQRKSVHSNTGALVNMPYINVYEFTGTAVRHCGVFRGSV